MRFPTHPRAHVNNSSKYELAHCVNSGYSAFPCHAGRFPYPDIERTDNAMRDIIAEYRIDSPLEGNLWKMSLYSRRFNI